MDVAKTNSSLKPKKKKKDLLNVFSNTLVIQRKPSDGRDAEKEVAHKQRFRYQNQTFSISNLKSECISEVCRMMPVCLYLMWFLDLNNKNTTNF